MTRSRWSVPVRRALLLVVVLSAPPVRYGLEATMTAQMLVQLPLLVAGGWLLSGAFPPRSLAGVERWNHRGITGLVLVTVTAAFWMLPRSLDAATSRPLIAAAKYLSVPLLIGLPFGVSWPRMGFVVRGLFLVELVATCFRLGWLYLISPIRLCNNYGLNDQQRLGGYLLAVGGGLLVWLAGKLLWGRFEPYSSARVHASPIPSNDASGRARDTGLLRAAQGAWPAIGGPAMRDPPWSSPASPTSVQSGRLPAPSTRGS